MALQRFPGLIDVHAHLREPGATQKEDFYTGSRAAVKGGFTFIIDMPNNPIPTFSPKALEEKIRLSKEKAICDIGFHYGTNGKNIDTFPLVWNNPVVFGLKLYCNHTTGDYLIEDPVLLEKVFIDWKSNKPILVHAEGEKLALTLSLAKKYDHHLHVCHITQGSEVEMVRKAKKQRQSVSAGVCPHHLFLTNRDVTRLGPFAIMKPPLPIRADQDALWEGIADRTIDLVETDHAPHTKEEKSKTPPSSGVPGLETAVGLLFKAVHEGRINSNDVLRLLYTAPKELFSVPEQQDTYVELDPEEEWTVATPYESKCGWSPFEGWELYGSIATVVIGGVPVLQGGKTIKKESYGKS